MIMIIRLIREGVVGVKLYPVVIFSKLTIFRMLEPLCFWEVYDSTTSPRITKWKWSELDL